MKLRSIAAVIVALVGAASFLLPEEAKLQVIARAAGLNAEGQFGAALDLIQPLIESRDRQNSAIVGVAWNIRGLSLQNLGSLDEARRSYESSIAILRSLPDQKIQYANALDNLGSLEADNGQLKESKTLRIRAKEYYDEGGDHAGGARAASNLSILELALGNRKEARRYLSEAYQEEARVDNPDIRDLAWTLGAECLLDEADGKFRDGLDRIGRVIDLWTNQYGPNYYLLASAYSIRGRLYDRLGDEGRAAVDLQHSLGLFAANNETHSKLYFLVEVTYAKVLKNSGKKDDAVKMESSARAALEVLRHQHCVGCTISVESIR